jgi:DNA-binding NarL/FixJ family response regulator
MKRIRVLLADDHGLVRAGFRSLLGKLPEVEVVAEATDGGEALALMKVHRPDIILMDISMKGMDGLTATRQAVKESPEVRVIILSMHDEGEYISQAFQAGAAGYLLKSGKINELREALLAVAKGEQYLSPELSVRTVVSSAPQAGGLSPRQLEVLKLIAASQTTKEIADVLKISPKTVETHRAELMKRLEIHDVAGLVRYVIQQGLLPPAGSLLS